MTAPTPPAARDAGVGEPDAGGGAAFVDAVDRMDEASSRLAILCATGALEGPELRAADDALTTARATLLAAHAAELARVTAERDELRDMLADRNALATDYAKVTAERDAAEQAAWHAGLDEGRAQGYARGRRAALDDIGALAASVIEGGREGGAATLADTASAADDAPNGLPPEVERAAIAAGKADRRARTTLVHGGSPRDALDDGR